MSSSRTRNEKKSYLVFAEIISFYSLVECDWRWTFLTTEEQTRGTKEKNKETVSTHWFLKEIRKQQNNKKKKKKDGEIIPSGLLWRETTPPFSRLKQMIQSSNAQANILICVLVHIWRVRGNSK